MLPYYQHTAKILLYELPFNSTSSIDLKKLYYNKTSNAIIMIFFADVDPDLNYITHANRNCYYFTINEYNNEYSKYNKSNNHLSLFHINHRSSSH